MTRDDAMKRAEQWRNYALLQMEVLEELGADGWMSADYPETSQLIRTKATLFAALATMEFTRALAHGQ